MPKVIEWVGAKEGDMVWRYPNEEIAWGDVLVVHEYEAAVFFRDGKAYDVFRAGRHVLTTANLPLLTKVLSIISGFDKVPFRATIVFVSLKQFQGRFGAQGQTKELAPLKFYGSFWFRVEDSNLFVNEVVGGQGVYTTERLQEFLRGYFNERLIDTLSQYSLIEVYGKLDETSFLAKNVLYDAFKRIGLELIDVKFEGIDTTPEWRDRLFYLRTGVLAPEVLRMETVQKTAESLSKSPGAAVGAGIAIIPPLFQQPTTQTQPMVLCPKCGFQNPQTAKFCGNCGVPLQVAGPSCPKCGTANPTGAKFCMNCGSPLQTSNKCNRCGSEVQPGMKFCPNCGEKLVQ
ncbi:MAG: SPFH domain-containing protein [Nitrososphaerota archaeon]|nr:SPFH domain-containing protein [Aigarchaeota archaeon]MDW8076654.1 SPFH domain-containing protein [Nitrososphaerota archaeon]